ncbi:hypothetical protein Tco_0182559, partial [Tanacetum coccineum]
NSMDTFLKLPTWTGTVVSKGNPIPEEQRPKPRAALEAAKKPATVEKEVVDLSGNTLASTPPVINTQPSLNHEQQDTYKVHSQSSH